MVGKRSINSAKIRSYIHTRYKLGIKAKEIYHEICDAYGTNEVSYTTVTRWIRRFKKGVDSVEDASRPGRKHSAITPKNTQKVRDFLPKMRDIQSQT